MTIDGKNRSPHQTFGRSDWTPDPGDADLNPKPDLVRPSRERMPFGPSREAPGGVRAGVLKPNGPGPFPDDIFNTPDITGLAWTRKRGNEWTTATIRGVVLDWLRAFFKARTGLVGWDITERANSDRMGSTRLPAKQHGLVVGITKRPGDEDSDVRVEVAIDFDLPDRVSPQLEVRLGDLTVALDALLTAIT